MTLSLPRRYHGLHGEFPLWLNSDVCPVLSVQASGAAGLCEECIVFRWVIVLPVHDMVLLVADADDVVFW